MPFGTRYRAKGANGMDKIVTKSHLRQFFCRHRYVKAKIHNDFLPVRSDRIYVMCEKCGKILLSYTEGR